MTTKRVIRNVYVYGHFLSDGTCQYIGQGTNHRAWCFVQRSKVWKSFFEKRKPQVKMFADGLAEIDALALECKLIAEHKLRGEALANCSGGGERGYKKLRGIKLSPKHCAAISSGKKGKSNGLLGATMEEEHKQKISEARLNSEAVKASGDKIWATRRANGTGFGWKSSKAKPVICIETGKTYRTAKDAALDLGISDKHIQACCVGRRKTHCGYTWRYEVKREVN